MTRRTLAHYGEPGHFSPRTLPRDHSIQLPGDASQNATSRDRTASIHPQILRKSHFYHDLSRAFSNRTAASTLALGVAVFTQIDAKLIARNLELFE